LETEIAKAGGQTVYLFPAEAREIAWVQNEIAKGRLIRFCPFRPTNFKDFLNFCSSLTDIVKANEINIIHAHFARRIALCAIQLVKMRFPKIKVVVHYHSNYFLSHKGEASFAHFIKTPMRRFIHRSNANIGISEAVTKNLPFKHNRHTVLNAVYYPRLDEYFPLTVKDLDIASNNRIICMFGYDFAIKGVDIAIRELGPIAAERKLILLIVCASEIEKKRDSIWRDFGYMPQWIKLAPPRLDVAAYYALADIFLSSSREEGFCYALVEAAYIKTPLVASDIPGQNELSVIPHSVFYDPQKPGALREAVLSVLDWSEAEKKQKTAEAREFVIKTFDLEAWAKKVIKIYQAL
jgi:glycosyltransferase involved in cell wall biosynthesis